MTYRQYRGVWRAYRDGLVVRNDYGEIISCGSKELLMKVIEEMGLE